MINRIVFSTSARYLTAKFYSNKRMICLNPGYTVFYVIFKNPSYKNSKFCVKSIVKSTTSKGNRGRKDDDTRKDSKDDDDKPAKPSSRIPTYDPTERYQDLNRPPDSHYDEPIPHGHYNFPKRKEEDQTEQEERPAKPASRIPTYDPTERYQDLNRPPDTHYDYPIKGGHWNFPKRKDKEEDGSKPGDQ